MLQTELTRLPNEHSLSLVEHVDDKAVQLKKFLCVLQFCSLSRKHSAGLPSLHFSFPEEHSEEKCTFSKIYIFLFFSDFECKAIGIFVKTVFYVPGCTFAVEILMEVSYFCYLFQTLFKFLRQLTTSLQKVVKPNF